MNQLREGRECSLVIRRALPDDIDILRDLACRSYTENFTQNWKDDGLAEYLEKTFGREVLARELADANMRYDLAFVDGMPAAFLKLKLDANLPGSESSRGMELNKLYILASNKGMGIGQRLMALAAEVAVSLEKELIWLAVLATNTAAIAFYTKGGFTKVGDDRLTYPKYKEELRDMWRMSKRTRAT
jgi:ribosomal protein S18 acetylase RimI-like enzyme